jgi:ankyrin repeat protein
MPLHLAPELITLIAESLNSTKDISSFAQTSRNHYASVIDLLYKRGQNDNEGRVLLWACEKGKERAAELAMRNYKTDDIDTQIYIYGKALWMASANGSLPLLAMIFREVETLRDQWDPYDCDNWVDEALGEAAKHGHLHVVQLLVKQGANVNYHSTAGTPLLQAAASGHGDVVEYLLKAGANIHSTNKYGHTALCEAAQAGDVKAAEALIKHGAGVNDTNHKDEDGNTALLLAAVEGHEEMVKYLLNAGVNIRHINACDETALQLAVVNGHENVARLLEQRSTYFEPEEGVVE